MISVFRNSSVIQASASETVVCFLMIVLLMNPGCSPASDSSDNGEVSSLKQIVVREGDSIQAALNHAASVGCRRVVVMEGVYCPQQMGQAFVYLNQKHEGIQLVADGDVVLTAENRAIADAESKSYPAVVNHVLYIGDGITQKTLVDGFRISGANAFQTFDGTDEIQPKIDDSRLSRERFFFSDGGGIKIFGRSAPTIRNVIVENNHADPCAGGVSVEHRGVSESPARFENCIFRENSCRLTGAAADLLPGSRAEFVNCLFIHNHGNNGEDDVSEGDLKYNSQHGCGALTVFPGSQVKVQRCTFVGNRNGVDDKGRANVYEDCLFWKNEMPGGVVPGSRFELHIVHAVNVKNCVIGGTVPDLIGSVDPRVNTITDQDPKFDGSWNPQAPHLGGIGFRSVSER